MLRRQVVIKKSRNARQSTLKPTHVVVGVVALAAAVYLLKRRSAPVGEMAGFGRKFRRVVSKVSAPVQSVVKAVVAAPVSVVKAVVAAPAAVVNTVKDAASAVGVSKVLQAARKTVVGAAFKGLKAIRVIKTEKPQPDGTVVTEQSYADAAGNTISKTDYLQSMVEWFKELGEPAAGELTGQGIDAGDVAAARSMWIAQGSPRNQPEASAQPAPAQPSTNQPSTNQLSPAQPAPPRPAPATDWKNPYEDYLRSGDGASGGGGGGGSAYPSAPSVSAPAVQAIQADAASSAAGAPKGKLNPIVVGGGAVAATVLMSMLGGK